MPDPKNEEYQSALEEQIRDSSIPQGKAFVLLYELLFDAADGG